MDIALWTTESNEQYTIGDQKPQLMQWKTEFINYVNG